MKRDDCPKGDLSPSFYDGTCGINISPDADQTHGSAPENQITRGTEFLIAYRRAKQI